MDKRLQNLNNSQMMSGVALFSTAALSVYSIKNIIEINKKLDEIQEDMGKIKHFVTENQRKNNITAANLGKKLEDVQMKFINLNQPMVEESRPFKNKNNNYVRQAPSPRVVVVDEVDDEVNNFLQA
jgi:hypothetical protein